MIQTLPDDIKKRGQILFYNGFGYQAPDQGTKDTFVIAILSYDYPASTMLKVKQESGSQSLTSKDWLGYTFVTVLWNEYQLIDQVLTTMLKYGMKFRTQNKLKIHFGENDECYSQEIAEKKWIDWFFKQSHSLQKFIIEDGKHNFFHEWNWKTQEGKEVCVKLRKMFHRSERCKHPDRHDYTKWPIFQNCDWNTLQTVESVNNVEESVEELINRVEESVEDEECMICMDNVADTMVLPCEHCVVCKTCSIRLRSTNDAEICVKCRRPITHVLD